MAEITIGTEQDSVVRNADPSRSEDRELDPGAPAQLVALRSLVDRAVQSRDLDQAVATRLAAAVDAATAEARLPAPRLARIVADLGDAKDIAAGAPTVVAVIEGVVMTLTG
ncbi:hypothetical protein ACFFQW_15735 [Umezawaea endophytica]|uniref:Uncharacterized protein n=1 Tax=Umezawaea endophytica TaxID=1654476 RepID=A0A9X2VT82_9PSEU|nr:hypothetical protein [Umezawaea endophytica]MCS7481689.1 hypothetical protein [Umezawaea endophytica]